MRAIPIHWTVETVVRRKHRINPKPQYQRTRVWNESKKQLLIDSILRQYDMPKFYLRPSGAPYDYEVVDGQQRLTTIWDFFDDKFALGEDAQDIPGLGDLSGRRFSQLTSGAQDRIALFELFLVEMQGASDLEIRDLFLRLQEGVTLNPAEKRNAMPGVMRDFVADLGENNRAFPLTSISSKRFAWHDLAALVMCLEIAEGPTEAKAPNLRKLYENNASFNTNASSAKKVKRTLNYMTKVLREQPPEMDIKWGFLDLYLLISKLDEIYVLDRHEEDFAIFYTSFEDERRSIQDPADLLSSNHSKWDRDMYDYIESFVRSGGTKQNIEKRHDVYKRRLLDSRPDLQPKDPTRAFTRDERIVVWRRDNESCKLCAKDVSLDEMHADHIVPHSRGGITTIENGQTRVPCNLSKGTSTAEV